MMIRISVEEALKRGWSFNYTSSQWRTITAAIKDGLRAFNAETQDEVICFEAEHDHRLTLGGWRRPFTIPELLLDFANSYRTTLPHHRPATERVKIFRRQLKAAADFKAASAEAEGTLYDEWQLVKQGERRKLLSLVDAYMDTRTRGIEDIDMLENQRQFVRLWSKVAKVSDHPRDVYFQEVVRLWVIIVGRLAFSRDSATNEPRGPLIRYLRAVTEPVMGQAAPTPEGTAKLICRERAWRKRARTLPTATVVP
jgi:hypothetical protein